jgi:hypothetical protein
MNYPIEEVRKLIELFHLNPANYDFSNDLTRILKERSKFVEKVFNEAFNATINESRPSRILISYYNSFDFCDVVDVVKDFRLDESYFHQVSGLYGVSIEDKITQICYSSIYSDYDSEKPIDLGILLLSDEEIVERITKSVNAKYDNWLTNVNLYKTWYNDIYEVKLEELREKQDFIVKAIIK